MAKTNLFSTMGYDENGSAMTCHADRVEDTPISINDLLPHEHPICPQCGAGVNTGLLEVRRNDSGCTCWSWEITCECGCSKFI